MSVLAPEAVARLLPDEPRWVEVRGMLLTGMGRPVGEVVPSPVMFVALYAGDDQAAVVMWLSSSRLRRKAGMRRDGRAVRR